jgi:hypothetical protein
MAVVLVLSALIVAMSGAAKVRGIPAPKATENVPAENVPAVIAPVAE